MIIYKYDVAVSFAGEDRGKVEQFVKLLSQGGVSVFYDTWEQHHLWGKDLYQYLDEIYRKSARYCVIFVSSSYVKKAWTSHELRSAQARAFQQKIEYILPIKLDGTELPGLPETVAYLDERTMGLKQISDLLLKKLGAHKPPLDVEEALMSVEPERRIHALTLIAINRIEQHLGTVAKMLNGDPNEEVRERAAWALDNLNDPISIPELIIALHDPSWGVRSNAGWALVHLGSVVKDVVRKVADESQNRDAREMARLVLERL